MKELSHLEEFKSSSKEGGLSILVVPQGEEITVQIKQGDTGSWISLNKVYTENEVIKIETLSGFPMRLSFSNSGTTGKAYIEG